MRPIERIDNFLEKVDWNSLYESWGLIFDNKKYYYLEDFIKLFKEYWKENPDQRIGQVLINLGIIPDGDYWNDEESTILKSQGYPPEDYLFWTSIYDENGELLDEPITRLVADLTPEHILRIIEYQNRNNAILPEWYNKAFENVLTKHLKVA